MKKGKVYIIGAGPGDAGLLTVKGKEFLAMADLVLFDRLANEDLLKHCKTDAELLFVGKAAGKHFVKQEETIRIMIDNAKQGRTIARLKGGDPFIFGRGSEEALALIEENIEFEVVPGVTSALGVSSYAGIPLTHRNLVVQTVFITAHESPNKDESQVDWKTLAKLKNTNLCIYMGVSKIKEVCKTLIENGLDPTTPAAAIQNGTLPTQRSFSTTVSELSLEIKKRDFKPPVLIIIGATADMNQSLSWFEKKPFFGKRIVSTRAKDQNQSLYNLLTQKGATVLPLSVIRTELSDINNSIKKILNDIKTDWIIFTSENGVRYFFELLKRENLDSRALGGIKIATIGTGTGKKLSEYNIIADFIPSKFTSASLIEELPKKHDIVGKRFLRVKGDFTSDPLTEGLIKCDAFVETIEVYKIKKDLPDEKLIIDLKTNGADVFLFTSISTVTNFFSVLGNDKALELLGNGIALAIGPVTGEALRKKGVGNTQEADEHTIFGLIDKLESSL